MISEMVQAHIFYSGMVQGVGFRYTTRRIAKSHGLQGWAKNLSDGRVEVLVHGTREAIEKMIKELDSHFGSYIREKNIDFTDPQGQFKDFQIIA